MAKYGEKGGELASIEGWRGMMQSGKVTATYRVEFMTASKKSPVPRTKKPSASKTNLPNPPEHKTFAIEQLMERWNCNESVVRGFIRDGDIKRTLVTADRPDLMDWKLYRCDENTCLRLMFPPELEEEMPMGERLLQRIWDGAPLKDFIDPVIPENIIHCLEYEYLYIPGESAIEKHRNKDNIIYVRYFCDLYGNLLIPVIDWNPHYEDENCIHFVPIEKHIYDSPLVSFEAVKQFENKTRDKKGVDAETIKARQRRIVRIIRQLKKNPERLKDERGTGHIKDRVRKVYIEEKMHEKIVERLGYDDLESFPEAEKNNKQYNTIKEQLEEGRNPYSKQQDGFFNKAWEKLYRENKKTGYYDLKITLKSLEDTKEPE